MGNLRKDNTMDSKANLSRRSLIAGGAAATAAAALGAAGVALADETAENRICKLLGIEKPVIQAYMGYAVDGKLAAAVSNAGGLGIVSPAELEEVKGLTDKPFGCIVYDASESTIATLKEHGVQIVIAALWNVPPTVDDPTLELTKPLKEAGFTVLFKGLNMTVEKLQAAQDEGADAIIVIGWGAGGTAPSEWRSVSALLANFHGKCDVPLIAAGGIVDAISAAGVAALGAEGVYCGTRFMLCEECPLPDVSKQALLETRAVDMMNVGAEWFNYHVTRNDANVEFAETHPIIAPEGEGDDYSGPGGAAVAGMGAGTPEDGVNCGEGIDSIESVLPTADIVNDIATAFGL